MSEYRKGWILRAYKKLEGQGPIKIENLQALYNAEAHPDVLHKKRAAGDALQEFLDTFQIYHSIFAGGDTVNQDEFEEYYSCVSLGIADDEEFALILRNVWKIDEEQKRKNTKN